ncbi:MAG: hypothetical protein Q7U45_02495, partial [Burkholderiaceae bacterium]|nr:hypothetical protein [Burkholderiaceae bacterium]
MSKIQYTSLQPNETILKTVRTWDISKGKTIKNDSTAGALMVLTNHGRIGVTNLIHGRFDNETKNTVLNTASHDGYNIEILIETGVAAAGELLYDEWEIQLEGYRVHRSPAINSKPDRATPLKNGIIDTNFFIDLNDSKQIKEVNKEFSAFPDGVHDDIVDSIAYGYIFLHNFNKKQSERRSGYGFLS